MKILTLSIKQIYFDEIKAGTKKVETREIRANNAHRYIFYTDGVQTWKKATDIPPDCADEVEPEAIKYDAIKFLTGAYSGTRPSILVEVIDEQVAIITDENDDPIPYMYEGQEYILAEIDYSLGEILES